ncbi:MAG: hypothetical protein ACK55Z_27625, partial [bacterium]
SSQRNHLRLFIKQNLSQRMEQENIAPGIQGTAVTSCLRAFGVGEIINRESAQIPTTHKQHNHWLMGFHGIAEPML